MLAFSPLLIHGDPLLVQASAPGGTISTNPRGSKEEERQLMFRLLSVFIALSLAGLGAFVSPHPLPTASGPVDAPSSTSPFPEDNFDDLLDGIRAKNSLPALAGAVVTSR